MKFERSAFSFFGGFLMYQMPDGTRQFIARLRQPKDRSTYITFLIKNFTVEEYIERLEIRREAPLNILGSKGYVSYNQKKAAQYRELAARFRGEIAA
ncbi:hypothetical protein PHIN3_84 [Sinorhizobium phage phiN3]|uniref:Uncharacterized protein n=1 Tax=Sinorhizobium phage phiN3 TaxID=1647405 RepID=A0A0F6SJ02_9CAUD|nr:hypothetical protein AVT40_gp084 [Sinorhizobium phage phiN3]AKF13348.1 hypothetical protein PHIN3_84 [Sinorhizobium phage phiN3]